jgi:hypothetical protein
LPVFIAGRVPGDMQRGGEKPESAGAWWRFKRLLTLIEQDWERNGMLARDCWRGFEPRLEQWTRDALASKEVTDPETRERALTAFMQRTWDETARRTDELEMRLRTGGAERTNATS